MRYRLPLGIVVALLGAVVLWLLNSHRLQTAARSAPENLPTATARRTAVEPPELASSNQMTQPNELSAPIQTRAVEDGLASRAPAAGNPSEPEIGPGLTPTTVLQNMRLVFRQYCSRFGGNPVGTNPEITSALDGANPGHVVFLKPEDGMRINHQGELVDNWGTPFFFHQLSGTEMEIHSAGPDRRMWTPDDLVIK